MPHECPTNNITYGPAITLNEVLGHPQGASSFQERGSIRSLAARARELTMLRPFCCPELGEFLWYRSLPALDLQVVTRTSARPSPQGGAALPAFVFSGRAHFRRGAPRGQGQICSPVLAALGVAHNQAATDIIGLDDGRLKLISP